MKLASKYIFLQFFWFFVVLKGNQYSSFLIILLSLVIVFADFFIYKPHKKLLNYLQFVIFLTFAGLLNDFLSIIFNFLDFSKYSLAQLSLWIVFALYYESMKDRFSKVPFILIFFLSGIIGFFTYLSAIRMGGLILIENKKTQYLLYQFMFWGAFFPFSLKMYRVASMLDFFLDMSVIFNFDHSGFVRHQKDFSETFKYPDAKEKNALVTGGSDGIGAMVVEKLSDFGASVFFTGRNVEKGNLYQSKISNSKFFSIDMSDWSQVDELALSVPELDYVVFNAGGMPEKLTFNERGVEHQCASQLVGHFRLLTRLKDAKKLKSNARIVFVSSGGMYLKSLDIDSLFKVSQYDKVSTYANVKRAQVTLVEELAKSAEWDQFKIMSMHPGWVETKGVQDALPGFFKLMGNRLRSTYEGADTILWCLLTKKNISSGSFFFDRKKVSPYLNRFFNPTGLERSDLLQKLKNYL